MLPDAVNSLMLPSVSMISALLLMAALTLPKSSQNSPGIHAESCELMAVIVCNDFRHYGLQTIRRTNF